jgi:uncharacterized protein (TIGR00725 family)
MPLYVAVVGPSTAEPAVSAAAFEIGRLLAERGAVVVTGGLGGVMAAAAAGAASASGISVGLLPGSSRADASPHTVALPTGLGELRNGLLVSAADGVLAVGGSWGALSEIALARRTGVPVVALGGWGVSDDAGIPIELPTAATPGDAIDLLLALIPRSP